MVPLIVPPHGSWAGPHTNNNNGDFHDFGGWILHCRSPLCLTQPEGTATPHIANQGVASHPSNSSPEISSVKGGPSPRYHGTFLTWMGCCAAVLLCCCAVLCCPANEEIALSPYVLLICTRALFARAQKVCLSVQGRIPRAI